MLNILLKAESSIKWCETKYSHSIYIAEFWNSLSGIFLSICAIYLHHIEKNIQIKKKMLKFNVLLFIVGIGTVLFHSKLLYIYQMLDEIPMILIINQIYKYIFVSRFNKIILYNISIPIIFSSYLLNHKLQIILFQLSIIANTCFILYHYFIKIKEFHLYNKYHKKAFLLLIFSSVIWSLDNNFCNYVEKFNLHAIWHVTTTILMYYLYNIVKYNLLYTF